MTRVDPPPGLLDKIAEAIVGGKERATLLAVQRPGDLVNACPRAERVAAAVVAALDLPGRDRETAADSLDDAADSLDDGRG